MGKNLLFGNVSKNSRIIVLHSAEAEKYGHKVFNLTDFPNSRFLNVCLVPFRKNSFFIQDIQPRHGGNTAKIIKIDENTEEDKHDFMPHVLFNDLVYTSIWEYI